MAIYEAYYRCRREPFSLSPDPSFLYDAPGHREALAQLRYLVQQRKGFAMLTGEVGMGKTMLLRTLIESVGSHVQTGYIFNPPRTVRVLYDAIADEFGLTLGQGGNPSAQLNCHFLSTYAKGGNVILIFDEAQSFSIRLLEEVRLFTNFETSNAKLVQVILAGQPELEAKLDSLELRALRQRLAFRFSLGPLGELETERYVAARLVAAGAKSSPFTLTACRTVHRYSNGVPRLINVICDHAMLAGYATDSPVIDERKIEEVAKDLKLTGASPQSFTQERNSSLLRHAPDSRQEALGTLRRTLLGPPPLHRRPRIFAVVFAAIAILLALAALATISEHVSDPSSVRSLFQKLFEKVSGSIGGSVKEAQAARRTVDDRSARTEVRKGRRGAGATNRGVHAVNRGNVKPLDKACGLSAGAEKRPRAAERASQAKGTCPSGENPLRNGVTDVTKAYRQHVTGKGSVSPPAETSDPAGLGG